MTRWVLVAWGRVVFDTLDRLHPNRPKGSDGSVGDTAHQKQKSGHNPDDTPGVQAERTDVDTTPEVRAIDITAATWLWAVIQAILGSHDKIRLIYIIYRGWIWRKANNWVQERYYGSDLHFGHAHLSGDPDYDNDNSPWTSLIGVDVNLSEPLGQPLYEDFNGDGPDPNMNLTVGQVLASIHMNSHYARYTAVEQLGVLKDIRVVLQSLAERSEGMVDTQAIITGVAGLLAPTIGKAVVDEVRERLES